MGFLISEKFPNEVVAKHPILHFACDKTFCAGMSVLLAHYKTAFYILFQLVPANSYGQLKMLKFVNL